MLPNRVLVDCLCSLTKNSHDKIDGLWYFQRDATGFACCHLTANAGLPGSE